MPTYQDYKKYQVTNGVCYINLLYRKQYPKTYFVFKNVARNKNSCHTIALAKNLFQTYIEEIAIYYIVLLKVNNFYKCYF